MAEDAFSKWIECFPMNDQRAETITNLLVEVFSRLGMPEFLHLTKEEILNLRC